jgi:hypothetical protein
MRDSPLVVITLLWIAALAFIVMRFDADTDDVGAQPDAARTPAPGETASPPPSLPTDVSFGLAIDDAGEIVEPSRQFSSETGIAYLAWLGEPVAANEVQLRVVRLLSDGSNDRLWDDVPQAVDADLPYVGGEFQASTLAEWGRGTYLLRIFRDEEEQLAVGVFQVDTATPEDITSFPARQAATLQPGDHVGYEFDEDGEVVGEHAIEVDEATSVQVARRATYAGTTYLLVVSGIDGRYWLLEGDAVILEDQA